MHRLAWYGWMIAVGFAALACGQRRPPEAPPHGASAEEIAAAEAARAEQARAALEADFAREAGELTTFEVLLPDGSVRARIEAAAPPQSSVDQERVSITAPFADGQAVQCFVYPRAMEGAELMRQLVSATLARNAPEHRWVDVHGGQANGWPYVIGRAHYVVDGPSGKGTGDFKIAVSVRDRTTVACGLDAPGYYASFERVLRGFLTSLDSASNRALPKPHSTEIARTRLAGQMVSLEATTEYKEARALVVEQRSMKLTIGDGGALVTSDEVSRRTYRKGKLETGTFSATSGGQKRLALELAFERRAYHVKGTAGDKGIEGEFTVEGGIPDAERARALACAVRDGKPPRAELHDYLPAVDPVGASTLIVERGQLPGTDLRLIVAALPDAPIDVKLDTACETERGTMQVGSTIVEIERLWREKGGV
jgi:hypothetical protein